jgi:hypothetical protein
MDEPTRDRANQIVADQFARQRGESDSIHQMERADLDRTRAREVESFADNRACAKHEYLQTLSAIERREREAWAAVQARQRTLSGRVAGMVRGRKWREQQAEQFTARFERERMAAHLKFTAKELRQSAIEQKARIKHDLEMKTMKERHERDRREQAQWQQQNREKLVAQQQRAMAELKLREALREQTRQQGQGRDQGLTRAFNNQR